MLPVALALKLKQAGLSWSPARHDFFAIPDRSMDEQVFVISDMVIVPQTLGGQAAVTFQGSVEWALDYLVTSDVIWLPSEAQLRDELERRLVGEPQPVVRLDSLSDGYRCAIYLDGAGHSFEAQEASAAYATALLYVLQHRGGSS